MFQFVDGRTPYQRLEAVRAKMALIEQPKGIWVGIAQEAVPEGGFLTDENGLYRRPQAWVPAGDRPPVLDGDSEWQHGKEAVLLPLDGERIAAYLQDRGWKGGWLPDCQREAQEIIEWAESCQDWQAENPELVKLRAEEGRILRDMEPRREMLTDEYGNWIEGSE
jgi:hypothetical protein